MGTRTWVTGSVRTTALPWPSPAVSGSARRAPARRCGGRARTTGAERTGWSCHWARNRARSPAPSSADAVRVAGSGSVAGSGPGDQLFEKIARAAHDEGVLGAHFGLRDSVGEALAGCLHADDGHAVLGADGALGQREPDRLAWRGHLDDRVAVVELYVVLQPAVDQVRHPAARVHLGPDDVLYPDPLKDAGMLGADGLGPYRRDPGVDQVAGGQY